MRNLEGENEISLVGETPVRFWAAAVVAAVPNPVGILRSQVFFWGGAVH